MDPNENLRIIRSLYSRIQTEKDDEEFAASARTLAEFVESLDNWIANGGFLPDDWSKA